jgi:hypothetical protein
MRHHEAPWDEDFDYLLGESESRDWWGETAAVEPDEPAPQLRPNDQHWRDLDDQGRDVDGGPSTGGVDRHTEFRTPTSGAVAALGFDARDVTPRHRPLPTRRSKPALIGLGIAVAAVLVAGLVLLLRGPADDQPTTVPSVTPSSSAAPPPASPTTLNGGEPIQSPPAPVPPPSSAEQITPAPDRSYPYYPRSTQPSATSGPRIDVTRAPMSVAPKPVSPPKTATPGQGPGPHGGFF